MRGQVNKEMRLRSSHQGLQQLLIQATLRCLQNPLTQTPLNSYTLYPSRLQLGVDSFLHVHVGLEIRIRVECSAALRTVTCQLPASTPKASSVQIPIEPRLAANVVQFSRIPSISLLFWYTLPNFFLVWKEPDIEEDAGGRKPRNPGFRVVGALIIRIGVPFKGIFKMGL